MMIQIFRLDGSRYGIRPFFYYLCKDADVSTALDIALN